MENVNTLEYESQVQLELVPSKGDVQQIEHMHTYYQTNACANDHTEYVALLIKNVWQDMIMSIEGVP